MTDTHRRCGLQRWLGYFVLGAAMFLGGYAWADEVRTVTVVYTCSNNGTLRACACPGNSRGGLARRARVLRDIRDEAGEILLLDSGDLLSPLKRLSKDETVLRVYGLLQYDAIAIGDQEFANGRAFFMDRVLTSGLPWMSATLRAEPFDFAQDRLRTGSGQAQDRPQGEALKDTKTKKQVAPPYIVKELSGVRVAVIGLVGPEAFRFMEPNDYEGITVADPIETMEAYLPELRRQADVVVVLSHLGDEGDVALAERVRGIDVIVGGHTEVLLEEPLKVGGTTIVQAGPDGETVGRLDLKVDPNGRIVETRNQMIPLDDSVPDDPEIARIVERYFSRRQK